eukprot:CAMPEP_0184693440 /NCGR_PEP_ID=MMETSP0313-20130426/1665_1 /TAXON_ID=2792 /ORGANISM="Porphyridium aerugineum, Strain SAG 1380-2" /LENGTH=430 /DNA_ID=CAMNT_0027151523 /DNA_START=294 /DNA_END=1586 /DNA_ORIENTATION=+
MVNKAIVGVTPNHLVKWPAMLIFSRGMSDKVSHTPLFRQRKASNLATQSVDQDDKNSAVHKRNLQSAESKAHVRSLLGSANLDWSKLGFRYSQTRAHIELDCATDDIDSPSSWTEAKQSQANGLQVVDSPYLQLHWSSTALQYGQACFEGLKAFATKDNDQVLLFRPDANAKRMAATAQRLCMPPVPEHIFITACKMVVKENLEFVPPYGNEAALYLRPTLIGSGPRLGVVPSHEFKFLVSAIPVGPYYVGGMKAVDGIVEHHFDRAAPHGTGNVKAAGNYAADLRPAYQNKKRGFTTTLYLDAQSKQFVEEFSASNFIGIKYRSNSYVTPDSNSVLPSITNDSLMKVAKEHGMSVERRKIHIDELEDFDEVGAVGTGVIVTPIRSLTFMNSIYSYSETNPVLQSLTSELQKIQNGEEEDEYDWTLPVFD